jgi:HEAT repeat protein
MLSVIIARGSAVFRTLEDRVTELVEQLHSHGGAGALCNLTSLGTVAIPLVTAAYDRETQPARRATLVHALWEFRDRAALPALAAALRDPDDRVWKEALDGIVTLGGTLALEVLQEARVAVETFPDAELRRQWIDEAAGAVKEAEPR